MKFTPKKEEELSANGFEPLPPGEYGFTVLESDEVPSKSEKNKGKIMVKLKLAIHGGNDRDHWVWDYFADWFSEWKLKHFADATGLDEEYAAGELHLANNNGQRLTGLLKLVVEEDKASGKMRNAVEDYVPRGDDVPF